MHNKIIKKFTEHPNSIGESYWQHFLFAFHISLESLKISAMAFTHALFPFLFVSGASMRLEKLHQIIQRRRQHEEKSLNTCCCRCKKILNT